MSYPILAGKTVTIKGDALNITSDLTTLRKNTTILDKNNNLVINGGLTKNLVGVNNVSLGANNLVNATVCSQNVAVGDGIGGVATSAQFNTLAGYATGAACSTLSTNTMYGYQCGYGKAASPPAMSGNVFVGNSIASDAGICTNNVVVGSAAGLHMTQENSVVIGFNSLGGASPVGTGNTIIGAGCGNQITTGSTNILIGVNTGSNPIATGSNNIYLANVGGAEGGTIRIGSIGTQTRNFQGGISGVTTGGAAVATLVDANGQLGTTSCDALKKKDFEALSDDSVKEFIHSIPVRSFHYKEGDQSLQIGPNFQDFSQIWAEHFPSFTVRNDEGKIWGLATQFLPWMLIHDLQRMQRELDVLKGVPTEFTPDYTV